MPRIRNAAIGVNRAALPTDLQWPAPWATPSGVDPLWIGIAFALGFLVKQLDQPPLVGYLAAGFVLNLMGVEGGMFVEELADFGVTLLLFTIGLKLRVGSLLRAEIWAGTSLHMLITVVVFGAATFALASGGVGVFAPLDLGSSAVIAFALSFSSTVFAVKLLEQKGEMSSMHGRTAIGILIMQDIIAVVFLTFSTGKIPSPWAPALLGLLAIRPLLLLMMTRSGHGELLILFGLLMTMLGGGVFELVGMKPDLGALVFGVLLSPHANASELSRGLLNFKDVFLVGFFLSVGLSSPPTLEALGVATLLVAVVPLKVALFFGLLTRFNLRARTSTLASLSLANYSEFGLIVGAVALANGWIDPAWMAVLAIAVSISFVAASPINASAHSIYSRHSERLKRFQSATPLAEDRPIDPGDVEVGVIGMGRVGTGAYDAMREQLGDAVVGIDSDLRTVEEQRAAGRNVVLGDPTDPDFWERLRRGGRARVIMLALPNHAANKYVVEQLREVGFEGLIAATAKYDDHRTELEELGVHAAYNIYGEAGTGFADHVTRELERLGAGERS